jgi:hypothetical protein
MNNDYIKKIKEALETLDSSPLFSDKEVNLVHACTEYLNSKGLKVIGKDNPKHEKINSIDKLINFYYELVEFKLKHERLDINLIRNNVHQDRKIASLFVKSRMEDCGIDEATALAQCAEIIKTVISNIDQFNFKVHISFSIFGQKRFGWVSEKAIDIINNRGRFYRNIEMDEQKVRFYTELMEKEYAKSSRGFLDEEV